jgi:hypothetical protein
MSRGSQQRHRSYPNMRRILRGTTDTATRNLANLTNQEQWMGLCELASNEHDQEKLGALFEGMLHLLEDQQARLNIAASRWLLTPLPDPVAVVTLPLHSPTDARNARH